MNELLETEVLVLGCGLAGGVAAYSLAQSGVSVTVVTRTKDAEESNTYYAQGGIIYLSEDDSATLLAKDILRAGAGQCCKQTVDILCSEGPQLVKSLLIEQLGVSFDRSTDGDLLLAREAGHSLSRIIHSADASGKAIEISLMKALRNHPNVQLLTGLTAIDLITLPSHSPNQQCANGKSRCFGAYLLDQENGQVIRCTAKKTILATGGYGQIFLCTTNPEGARGDGLAMAYRAGAKIINTEFVQFHPTVFHKPDAPRFLISEAVRGAGARLINAEGEPFMDRYDHEWKDLATRDIVARSVHQEMLKSNLPNVFLDMHSYIDGRDIRQRFPNIYQQCMKFGIDATKDPVPVVPGAHYSCGGVWADYWGKTDLESLYAVGEVACTGVHGANRLASASLLEALVWGHRAAKHILSVADPFTVNPIEIPSWNIDQKSSGALDPAVITHGMSQIKHIMWNYVGLVRSGPKLQRAIRELKTLEAKTELYYQANRLTDDLMGLRNAARTASVVTSSALENEMSMGCHFRV